MNVIMEESDVFLRPESGSVCGPMLTKHFILGSLDTMVSVRRAI